MELANNSKRQGLRECRTGDSHGACAAVLAPVPGKRGSSPEALHLLGRILGDWIYKSQFFIQVRLVGAQVTLVSMWDGMQLPEFLFTRCSIADLLNDFE